MAASDYFGNIGSQLLGGLSNAIFGGMMSVHNAAINHKYNELSAEAADARQRALYTDFMSPAARIKQLREAGLSPSLFADGAGAGSQGMTTGAQGAGASGVSVPTGFLSPESIASTRLMNAQAEKAEAEAATERGDNERGQSDIAVNWAEAGAKQAAAKLTKAQTTAQEIDNFIKDSTKEYSIWEIKSKASESADMARKAFFEADREGLAYNKDLATFNSEVEVWSLRAADLAADIALKKSQTQLNKAEKDAIKDYVQQGLQNAESNAKNAQSYSDYVEAFADNLPKQLELRDKELKLEKWKVGLQPFIELIKTAGYIAGASQLGDGGYESFENTTTYDKNGKPTGSQTKKGGRTKLPKVR